MGDQLGGTYRGPDQAETPDRGRLQDRSAQRHAEQPDIAERVLVPDPAAEQVMANAGGQQPGSEVMRLRGRGGVLERAGVGSPVSYTHLRAHETPEHLVCRLL